MLSTRNECGFCTPQAKSCSLLVSYKTLARALGKALAKHSQVWLLCTSVIHKLTCQAFATIGSSKKAAGPPAWWWSGLALSAAVACGSEKFARTPLLVYIGASVAVVASRRLMAPNKRPPTPAETKTLAAIRADLKTPFDEATHSDLLKRLWKAGLDGPFERRSQKWQLLGFQGTDPATDLRACKLLGLKTLVTFLEKSPGYAEAILASRRITGDFDPRKPGFYPVACAGIETTAFLCECCGLRGPNGAPPPADLPHTSRWAALVGTTHSFDECFSAVLRALDRRFEDERGDYMGFASVRDAVFADVGSALDQGGPASEVERSLRPVWKSNFGRPTPSTRHASVAASEPKSLVDFHTG